MIKKVSKQSSSRRSSSRKSSPKRSSPRKSSSVVKKFETGEHRYDITTQITLITIVVFIFLFSIAVNLLILYYLNNLEPLDCKCIRDWRHNFIKYMTIFNLICSFLLLFGINMRTCTGISGIITILSLVNLYAFFTYIGDLNNTKCICAVQKQKNLNTFLNIWRYIMVIVPVLALIGLIRKNM